MKITPKLGASDDGGGGGSGGVTSYNELSDKPILNGVLIVGNKTSKDYGLDTEGTYTNLNPSVVKVGAINIGTSFDNKTMTEMFDAMFYEEQFPTLTNPSGSFTLTGPTLVEVNIPFNLTFTSAFNRGSINPSYGTNGYRSGSPTKYNYTGPGVLTTELTALRHTQTLTDYKIETPSVVTWSNSITYAAGEQPLSSYGKNYGSPYPAGTTKSVSLQVTAVYPIYGNTSNIGVMSKQSLVNPSEYFEIRLVAETPTQKQSIEWWAGIGDLTGVEVLNSLTKEWEWLGGSKDNSKLQWAKSTMEYAGVPYSKYTNIVAQVGARSLRFYFK